MPTTNAPGPRAPGDRRVLLDEAAHRTGYQPETLRKLMAAGQVPGARKIGGRWKIWTSDLDRWADSQPEDDRVATA